MSENRSPQIQKDGQRNKENNTDNILKAFDKWHVCFQSVLRERNELHDELQAAHQEKQLLADANQNVKNEFHILHKTLKSTNSQLNRICDLEDENRNLKCISEEKDEEIDDMRKQLSEEISNHRQILQQTKDELKSQHVNEMNTMKMEATLMEDMLHKQIQDRDRDLGKMEVKVAQLQKDNIAELSKLSMEYENKLARLQRQKSQASLHQGSFSNNEIFRKKLQSMKTEFEVEVSRLKTTISSLEGKLTQASHTSTPLKPQHHRLQIGKRKRME